MGILHIGHSLLRVNCKSNIFLDNNIMGIRKTRKKRGGGPNQTVSKSQSLQTIGEESRTMRKSRSMAESWIEQNCENARIEFKKLAERAKLTKGKRVAYRLYQGGCDLFIYNNNQADPHIHVYGFAPLTKIYYYSVSGKGKHHLKSKLWSDNKKGYDSVLTEMYNALDDTAKIPNIFITPSRRLTKQPEQPEQPTKKKIPKPLSVFNAETERVSRKLGPNELKDVATPLRTASMSLI